MKRVLIAEDSSVIQNLVRKIIEFQNTPTPRYEVKTAKNGKEVIDMINTESYDMLLLDINMPVMDGMETAKTIRKMKDGAKANIPILAITGNGKSYSQRDFTEAGINEYMPKPLNFDLLLEKVKGYLDK